MELELYDWQENLIYKSLHVLGEQTLGFKVEFVDLAPNSTYSFVYWSPDQTELKYQGAFKTFPNDPEAFSI